MRFKPDRCIKLHGGEQKASVSRNGQHLLGRTNQRGRYGPGERNPESLLPIADEHLACAEAVEMPCKPDMKGTHVGTQGHVRGKNLLELRNQTERMNGISGQPF